jgi:hypothetical protein
MQEVKDEQKTPHMVDMDTKVESPREDLVATGDLISYNGVDPALAAKMHIVNDVGYLSDSPKRSVADEAQGY